MNNADQIWPGSEITKFPDLEPTQSREHLTIYEEDGGRGNISRRSSGHSPNGRAHPNGLGFSERWLPRKDSLQAWSNGQVNNTKRGHGRQKSLGDAIKTIRTRRGSVSANAQELAEALKAPVSYRLISLCLVWYFSSALTNASSKTILTAYNKPITLTIIQFAFVFLWCLFFAYVARIFAPIRNAIPALKHGIRYPTREVISTTMPLALFQLGGHVLSSAATAQIPVSLVHTIKGLSPLFTVLAYRFIFNIHYATNTYLSLVPLTLGVVLACSVEFAGNVYGITCAFIAALIFVSQNIFSKKLFNEAARAESDAVSTHAPPRKLDKLNLLCYCSGLAFLLTFPLWLWTEGFGFLQDIYHDGAISLSNHPSALDHGRLTLEFIFNGVFHFGQNIMAFILLSMVSPVTYSVASLIKRVFVIVVAIVWFDKGTNLIQMVGIGLTFLGLYLYDRTSDAARADRRAKMNQMKNEGTLLPLVTDLRNARGGFTETPSSMSSGIPFGGSNGYIHGDEKKVDAGGPGRPRSGSAAQTWLPPGTRQEETWRPRDAPPVI